MRYEQVHHRHRTSRELPLAERLRKMDEAKAFDRAYYIRRIWPEVCAVVEADGAIANWEQARDTPEFSALVANLRAARFTLSRCMDEEGL